MDLNVIRENLEIKRFVRLQAVSRNHRAGAASRIVRHTRARQDADVTEHGWEYRELAFFCISNTVTTPSEISIFVV